ncbi:hypothetical protein B0E43_07115 [Algoriphagus sp. A40]|nr:hypothetical protein B0E43_07115 [Algoriphagus sp. A40]
MTFLKSTKEKSQGFSLGKIPAMLLLLKQHPKGSEWSCFWRSRTTGDCETPKENKGKSFASDNCGLIGFGKKALAFFSELSKNAKNRNKD